MMKQYFIYPIFLLFIACSGTDSVVEKQSTAPKSMMDLEPNVYHCELVEKTFVNKGGKITEYTELYLRCSVQDYFIKLCESSVKKEDLMPYLNKGISVEVEIKDGMWDHCSDDPGYAQSRMGMYAVIKKIND